MTTTYGTIPTSTSGESSAPLSFISRAKARGRSALANRRPWRELAHAQAFSFPRSLGEVYLRIRSNSAYFAMNYVIVVLLIIFLSLLWHPVSLIIFSLMMAAWLFLYFLRDDSVYLFGRIIHDRFVLIGLSILTLVLLLFTGATLNILISLLVGVLVILLHAAFRLTDDLALDGNGSGWYVAAEDSARPS